MESFILLNNPNFQQNYNQCIDLLMDLCKTCFIETLAFTNSHANMDVSFLKNIVPSKCVFPSVKMLQHWNHYIETSMKCESFGSLMILARHPRDNQNATTLEPLY